MARASPSGHAAPETDATLLASHRLDAPLEVIGWLRQLRERGAEIVLFGTGFPTPLSTRLLAANAPIDRIVFDAEGLEPLLRAGPHARATAIAFIDRVKVQFDAGPFASFAEAGCAGVVAPLPAKLHRLQRRDAFRVTPPAPRAARCALDAGSVHAPTYPVVDLSVGGLSLIVPAEDELGRPAQGMRWSTCLLELPGVAALRCALVLVHAESLGTGRGMRLGLRFEGLGPHAERDVQRYVIAAQRSALKRSCS